MIPKTLPARPAQHPVAPSADLTEELRHTFTWQVVAIVLVLALMVALALMVPSLLEWWNRSIIPRFA